MTWAVFVNELKPMSEKALNFGDNSSDLNMEMQLYRIFSHINLAIPRTNLLSDWYFSHLVSRVRTNETEEYLAIIHADVRYTCMLKVEWKKNCNISHVLAQC